MDCQNEISIYTSNVDLGNEIFHLLLKNGNQVSNHDNAQLLIESITAQTTVVIIDYESGLLKDQKFINHIKLNHSNSKLVVLTSIENLAHCYPLLGNDIFEIVVKNQRANSKIKRIMDTLNYYNQFSSNT